MLDSAYEWLCRRRRDYSANADVWAFRRGWERAKEQIKDQLRSGNYRFSLLSRVTLETGEETDLWAARDALVLKAFALVLAKHLPASHRCTHLKFEPPAGGASGPSRKDSPSEAIPLPAVRPVERGWSYRSSAEAHSVGQTRKPGTLLPDFVCFAAPASHYGKRQTN